MIYIFFVNILIYVYLCVTTDKNHESKLLMKLIKQNKLKNEQVINNNTNQINIIMIVKG